VPAAENIAIARRVEELEQVITRQDLLLIRTTLVVSGRGPEPRYRTAKDVWRRAGKAPKPIVIERRPDLELLLDPIHRTRKLRHLLTPADQLLFDEIKSRPTTKILDVEITCHEAQLDAIISEDPIVATFGGNRAGKSMVLIWWLFRRWMLRGGTGKLFWWVSPTIGKALEQGARAICGDQGRGGGLWPDELFPSSRAKLSKTKPSIQMIDGSTLAFQHAATSGTQAGSNLKSANVTDAVIDEFGAVPAVESYLQVLSRLTQQGGHLAVSSTKVKNHWSNDVVASRVDSGGISIHNLGLQTNPWNTQAAIWQLLLNYESISVPQLEEKILIHDSFDDQFVECKALVKDPNSLREHFGEIVDEGLLMWPAWTGQEIVTESNIDQNGLWITDANGKAKKLINVTRLWLSKNWPKAGQWDEWAGMDFNWRGHSVVLKLFAEGKTAEEAFANRDSWTAIVVKEIDVEGTTSKHAKKLTSITGKLPIYGDPTGAASGHDLRGTGGSTDIIVLQKEGYLIEPAIKSFDGKYTNLSFRSSANVMNVLMESKRLRVHKSCTGVLDSLKHDQAGADGKRKKTYGPNSESDKRSGYTDAIRYGLWPVFSWLVDGRPKAELLPQS